MKLSQLFIVSGFLFNLIPAHGADGDAAARLQQAEELFAQKNFAEARAAFDQARTAMDERGVTDESLSAARRAVECSIRLREWNDALERGRRLVDECHTQKGTGFAGLNPYNEARAERLLAALYLQVPHNGTKQGGVYFRGEYKQGVHVSSFKQDRREAIQHLERARSLLMGIELKVKLPDEITTEKIAVDFELAIVLAQRDEYNRGGWGWCGWWWDAWEAEEESDAVDEADYEQPRGWRGYAEAQPPSGLPLGADGQPVFPKSPSAYDAKLGDAAKIRFLLEEIQRLDESENRDDAARALYQRGMQGQLLFGADVQREAENARQRYDRAGRPLTVGDADGDAAGLPSQRELADDEAITLVGGKLRVVKLPDDENPLTLWREVARRYPRSEMAAAARYAEGFYHQQRQQFSKALAVYEQLVADKLMVSVVKQQMALIKKTMPKFSSLSAE